MNDRVFRGQITKRKPSAVEIIPSSQACAGARLFLSFLCSQAESLGKKSLALMLMAAVTACVKMELAVTRAKHLSTDTN